MTVKQTQCLLAYLGYYTGQIDGQWGGMSTAACRAFQADYGLTADGICGTMTQKMLIGAIAGTAVKVEKPESSDAPKTGTFWDEIEFFDPEEMKCKCGGKYCSGFPHEIQPLLMQILDRARRWSGHPIVIVSGLRCKEWNRIQKGVATSQHQYGEAADVYFYGVSANTALEWLQSQPDVRYAYRIEGCNNIHFDIQPVGR